MSPLPGFGSFAIPGRVLDASVVAAWCYDEPHAREAAAIIEGAELYAPTLLAYELTNVARKKAGAYPERLNALTEALQTALAIPIHWVEVDHTAVLRLALNGGLTTYDASYLYLARTLGVPLATFDQRLARAAMNVGA